MVPVAVAQTLRTDDDDLLSEKRKRRLWDADGLGHIQAIQVFQLDQGRDVGHVGLSQREAREPDAGGEGRNVSYRRAD